MTEYAGRNTLESVFPLIKGAISEKQDKAVSVPVTLPAAGWDAGSKVQTVAVPGVSADEAAQLIQIVPTLASQSAYYEAGILCTGQSAGGLKFTAWDAPTVDLTVYVVIQEVAT